MNEIVAACMLFICCAVALSGSYFAKETMAKSIKNELVIRTFDSQYEPSAIVSLGGGKFLIFEDDGREMISSFSTIMDDSGPLLKKTSSAGGDLKATDIEGATMGAGGQFFAVTSHSLKKDGKRDVRRERFLRLALGEKLQVMVRGQSNFREAMVQELLKVDRFLAETGDELNIEGLTFAGDKKTLMIGLRAPLAEKKAVMLLLENPYDLGKDGFVPEFSDRPILLDLGGAGVRAMTFAEKRGLYFFVSEVESKKGKMKSRLWSWSGEGKDIPRQINFAGLKHLHNIEGLAVFTYDGKEMLLLVCDDGEKKKKQGAHYAIIEGEQLR